MSKRNIIIIITLVIFITVHGQEQKFQNSESFVVMSEEDISSLVKILSDYKKREIKLSTTNPVSLQKGFVQTNSNYEVEFLRREIQNLEQQLAKANTNQSTYQKSNIDSANDVTSLQQREIKNLKYEIERLRLLLNNRSSENSDLVVVTPLAQGSYQPVQKETIRTESLYPSNENDLIVKAKLDSLNMLFKSMQQHTNDYNYGEDFIALENRIEALKNELLTKNNSLSSYNALVNKYKGYSRTIYFDNNSIALNQEGQKFIDELFEILNSNDNLDVVIKGFASNKGKAIYNENLSMNRTESVKKALILKGIHPTRVLTQYHGIDYQVLSEADARRVELGILVRK